MFRLLLSAIFVLCTCISYGSTLPKKYNVPAAFEANVGQALYTDGTPVEHIDALLSAGSVRAFIHNKGMFLALSAVRKVHPDSSASVDIFRTDIELIASNPFARLEILEGGDGFVRFIGMGDGKAGRIAQRYRTIIYKNVYRYIDMRLTASDRGPKIDFIVHPGGNPSDIAIRYSGTESMSVTTAGELIAATPLGSLIESAPISWTESRNGYRTTLKSSFRLSGSTIRFTIDDYNPNELLVIDPQRVWATYYGGNSSFSEPLVSMDTFGNVFMAGSTSATDLPKSTGVFQRNYRGNQDAYVVKFNDKGVFQWHTYMGGTGAELLYDATTNDAGELWICGRGDSPNTPLFALETSGSGPIGYLQDDTLTWTSHGWVMRVKADGSWGDSWLLDSDGYDAVTGIDYSNNRLALIGTTRSRRNVNNVAGNPYKRDSSNNYNNRDAFISKLILRTGTTDRWESDWFTYYGGKSDDDGIKVSVDINGNVVAVGETMSNNIPVSDASTFRGIVDSWVIKFTTPTKYTPARAWASYFGGTELDKVTNITIDNLGFPVIVGYTASVDFPVSNALKGTLTTSYDGYIRKLNGANGAAVFSTYFGGNKTEKLTGVMTDRNNRIWVCGEIVSTTNMPVSLNAFQAAPNLDPGGWPLTDGYFAQLSADGANVLYGSYYGAPPQETLPPFPPPDPPTDPPPPNTDWGSDNIADIWIDNNAYVILGSYVNSIRMSTTPGAYQDSSSLRKDTMQSSNFLSYFTNCTDSIIKIIINGTNALCASDSRQLIAPAGFAKYLWSTGDTTRQIVVTDSGRYIVTSTTLDGCRYRDTVFMTKNPQPSVSAGADTSGCVNTLIQLTATPLGGTPPYKYKWKRIEAGPGYINDDTLQSPGVNPNTTSRYIVTLTDSVGCTAKDTVLVNIINPKPTFTPDTVRFGQMDACESVKDTFLFVKNPMTYPITITEFSSSWTIINLVTSVSPPPVLAPGDSIKLTVRISPITAGLSAGTFTIKGSPCNWTLAVPFSVTKQTLLASVSPSVIDFGSWPDCESIKRDSTLTIFNGSPDPMILQQPIVGLPFSATASITTIQPGDSAIIDVSYDPTTTGQFTDVVRIAYTAGTCTGEFKIDVRGAEYPVSATLTPNTIDFGSLEGCQEGKDSAIVISNTSQVPITVNLQPTAEVTFVPSGMQTINANESVTILVTIRPASPGIFSATIPITFTPCNGQFPLTLTAEKNGIAFSTPDNVEFGELNSCTDPPTSTKSYSISFEGTGSSLVTSVTYGATLSTTLGAGTVLQSGVPQSFDVTWSPGVDGVLDDSIVVVFSPCAVRRVIRVGGVRTTPALRATTPVINSVNVSNGLIGTLEFENIGTDTIRVNVLSLSPDIVVSNQNPDQLTDILPGEFVSVDYALNCRGRIDFADSIVASTTGTCKLDATSVLTGNCLPATQGTASVVIDTAAVNIGTRFKLPMRLVSSSGLNAVGLYNWRAEVTYDPLVVVGMGSTPDCYVSGQDLPCTITVSGTRTDTVGTLYEFDFTAVLGPREVGKVELSSFVWVDDTTIASQTQNGYVRLADICYAGGPRLLTAKASAFSINVYPNPASDVFNIKILGMGQTPGSWSMYNYIGSLLDAGPLVADVNGDVFETITVTKYSSGTYFLTIDARGSIFRTPLIISR
ncbi:MAG: choice-of-anchor D domain-containing protein [Ignavibacteria bacterium]|nr:choice-of-anchor D domain-containing protein [Ignavibacteria bacterium]